MTVPAPPRTYTVAIDEEDDWSELIIDDRHGARTIHVDAEAKTYKDAWSVKDDVFYATEKFEYRITTDPTSVEVRLIESKHEPPKEYEVRDGVVLEADMLRHGTVGGSVMNMTVNRIADLKKEVEWHAEPDISPVSMYILSLHPELVPPDDFRRHLRRIAERIKAGLLKIEKYFETDSTGLQITDEYVLSGRSIWYPKATSKSMSEEERKKAGEQAERIQEKLFDEKAPEYVGISKGEFRLSPDLLPTIDLFLERDTTPKKVKARPTWAGAAPENAAHTSGAKKKGIRVGWKWLAVLVLSIIALSWGVWTAIGVFILGAIIVGVLVK